jgi:hypothetical protein
MQIVIDIPEEEYNIIKGVSTKRPMLWAEYLIANGTQLPKGHGRLIDADYKVSSDGRTIDTVCGYMAPTIIEADKEIQND